MRFISNFIVCNAMYCIALSIYLLGDTEKLTSALLNSIVKYFLNVSSLLSIPLYIENNRGGVLPTLDLTKVM